MIGCAYSRGQWSNDFANPLRRHADIFGQAVFRQAKRLEEFLFKHLAGGNRLNCTHGICFRFSQVKQKSKPPRPISGLAALMGNGQHLYHPINFTVNNVKVKDLEHGATKVW